MERLQLEFSKSSLLSRDASTAKVGYVIASSGQSLTDTTLLRPSLSICGRRFYHPPRRPSPSLVLSNPREKENQAFVRTFLGHHQPPYQPFTLRSPSLSVTSRLPLRGKTEEPMKRPPWAWDTYATRRSRSAHVPPRESDISVWFRWREFFFFLEKWFWWVEVEIRGLLRLLHILTSKHSVQVHNLF